MTGLPLSRRGTLVVPTESGSYRPRAGGGAGAFAATKALLDRGQSAVIGVCGDSTAGGTTRPFYLFMQSMQARYPDATVWFRSYNISTLKWNGAKTRLQQGAAGDRRMYFTGVANTAGMYEAAPGTTFNNNSNITGPLDLRIKVAPDKWGNGVGAQTLVAKFGNPGTRGWRWQLQSGGQMSFDWTTDGTTLQAALVSSAAVSTVFADGAPGWVRMTFEPNNGGNTVCTFYTGGTDGNTWTQLGTAQTRAGATSIVSLPTYPCEIASRSGGGELLAGYVYEVEIRNGIDGPIVCQTWPELWTPTSSNFNGVLSGARVIDMWDASWSGGNFLSNILPNKATMVPAVGMSSFIVDCGHNEPQGNDLFGRFDTLVNYALGLNPGAGVAITAQNPKIAPNAQRDIDRQARITALVEGYAAQRGYTAIPVYEAFLKSSHPLTDLVISDGIHPSDTYGSPLWRDTMLAAFDGAVS